MKRIKFPQHNKTNNITAIQTNILKVYFFCISGRNHTKKSLFSDRHQIRLSDVGFLFSNEIQDPV
jgi:hypothetical protein